MTVADGRWEYSGEGARTHITWTYTCALTTPVIAPLAALLVKVFMKSAMADCLVRLKTHCEAAPRI